MGKYDLSKYSAGFITKIQLKNFMNLETFTCEPSPKLNFFFGHNYEGKTALLRGIFLGLGGVPTLGSKVVPLIDLIKRNETESSVELHLLGKEDCLIKFKRTFNKLGVNLFELDEKVVDETTYLSKLLELGIDAKRTNFFMQTIDSVRHENAYPENMMKKAIDTIGGKLLKEQIEKYNKLNLEIKKVKKNISNERTKIRAKKRRLEKRGTLTCEQRHDLNVNIDPLYETLGELISTHDLYERETISQFRKQIKKLNKEFTKLLDLMDCNGHLVMDTQFKKLDAFFGHSNCHPMNFTCRGGGEISIIYTLFNLALSKITNFNIRLVDNVFLRLDDINKLKIFVPVSDVVTDKNIPTQFFICAYKHVRPAVDEFPLTEYISMPDGDPL